VSVARVPIGPVDDPPISHRGYLLPETSPSPVPASLTAVPVVELCAHGRTRRVIEVVIAATSLVVLTPLLLLIAIVVATTSRGPVLYRQQRIGIGGRPFEIVKFRTMRADAESMADALFARCNEASGPLHKVHNDPRVTRIGLWLRHSSLDELPQLWNVLTGTMALVGPRPATPGEVAQFAPRDHQRHAVRPGITGITQVNGRSDLDWDIAVCLDLLYVENRSLWLDFRILLRTVPAVLGARGAY
jgi:lipopolysaccharide/colanic/teichoic acid biosynthesis glycosyltransferase